MQGKIYSRGKVLDGANKAYFVTGQEKLLLGPEDKYINPTDWPAVGYVLRQPQTVAMGIAIDKQAGYAYSTPVLGYTERLFTYVQKPYSYDLPTPYSEEPDIQVTQQRQCFSDGTIINFEILPRDETVSVEILGVQIGTLTYRHYELTGNSTMIGTRKTAQFEGTIGADADIAYSDVQRNAQNVMKNVIEKLKKLRPNRTFTMFLDDDAITYAADKTYLYFPGPKDADVEKDLQGIADESAANAKAAREIANLFPESADAQSIAESLEAKAKTDAEAAAADYYPTDFLLFYHDNSYYPIPAFNNQLCRVRNAYNKFKGKYAVKVFSQNSKNLSPGAPPQYDLPPTSSPHYNPPYYERNPFSLNVANSPGPNDPGNPDHLNPYQWWNKVLQDLFVPFSAPDPRSAFQAFVEPLAQYNYEYMGPIDGLTEETLMKIIANHYHFNPDTGDDLK